MVTDFGLAKSLGEGEAFREGEAPAEPLTQTGAIVGTPSYMAPEQARAEKLLSTAVDVYSLGAILYELLTGRPPFRADSVLETLVQVRDREPEPPSRLNPLVDRDLETICLKCLQKDPQRRYGSAEALADELDRHTRGEPILARPVGRLERTWRWCRRNPGIAGLTAAVALLLVAVSIVSIIYAIDRENARQRIVDEQAATEAARQDAVNRKQQAERAADHAREVIESMSSNAAIDHLSRQPELTKEQRQLLEKMIVYYQEHARQAVETEQERARQGRACYHMGRMLQILGQHQPAEGAYRRAQAAYQTLVDAHPDVPAYSLELAATHNNLGVLFGSLGDHIAARRAFQAAFEVCQRLVAEHPGVPDYARQLAATHGNLALLLRELGDQAGARQAYEAALKLGERLVVEHPAVPGYTEQLAATHNNLGNLLHDLGDNAAARRSYEMTRKLREQLVAEHPHVAAYANGLAAAHTNLGNLLSALGDRTGARHAHRAALKVEERLVAEHPGIPEYTVGLAGTCVNLANLGDSAEPDVLYWYGRAIALLRPILASEPRHVTARRFLRNAYIGRAGDLDELGRHREALADWDSAVQLDEGKLPEIRLYRAVTLAKLGNHGEATAEADELAKEKNAERERLYDAARVFALSSAAAAKDVGPTGRSPLQEQYAARAVELLRQAVAKGYKDLEHVKKDPDLDPLRKRADFQKLLADLEQQTVELIPPPRIKKE